MNKDDSKLLLLLSILVCINLNDFMLLLVSSIVNLLLYILVSYLVNLNFLFYLYPWYFLIKNKRSLILDSLH